MLEYAFTSQSHFRFHSNPSKVTRMDNSSFNFSVSIVHMPKRSRDFYDLHKELVPYPEAWSWQNAVIEERKSLSVEGKDLADTLIILHHKPVYTLGAGSMEEYLNFDVNKIHLLMCNEPTELYCSWSCTPYSISITTSRILIGTLGNLKKLSSVLFPRRYLSKLHE
ncbi:uncharacterized protein [Primulina huaijiensis]|uniref:uncharacterized protein n=1 Tax=Primulina huaijiensis TaxID=1492673 RepID=UPI003CC70DE6